MGKSQSSRSPRSSGIRAGDETGGDSRDMFALVRHISSSNALGMRISGPAPVTQLAPYGVPPAISRICERSLNVYGRPTMIIP